MAEAQITYEGIDHSEHDAMFRRDYALPGDKIRVDPSARIVGVDMKEIEGKLGLDVLTVSKTIMTGQHEEDIVGGTRTSVIPRYEFEGVEGRFPAKAFQPELGAISALGVLAVQDGRLWAVPMNSNGQGDVESVKGPAREVVGFAGKHQDQLDPEGLPGMKAHIGDQPQLGEFYYQSATSFEDQVGPVNLLAAPWMSNADTKEAALATRAINLAVFEQSIDDVVVKSQDILRQHNSWEGQEPGEVNDLLNAIHDRTKEPSARNSGGVLDAAEAMLGMLDDRSLSNSKSFDALATSVDQAGKAADRVLSEQYADLGITPAAARQMEALTREHDKAIEDLESSKPSLANKGAAMAAMAGRGV